MTAFDPPFQAFALCPRCHATMESSGGCRACGWTPFMVTMADDLHSPAVDGHEWKELGIVAHMNRAQRLWRLKSHRPVWSIRHAPR